MILGFKPQFVEPILKGTKIHSIREDKHNRWKRYKLIHMATGVRTKQYKQFLWQACIRTQTIEIYYKGDMTFVKVDNRPLIKSEVEILAKNDGFGNIEEFFKWFNKDFTGKIIHWTDFRY